MENIIKFCLFLSVLPQFAFAAKPASNALMPTAGIYINSEGSPIIPLLTNATKSIDIEIYTMKDATIHSLLRSAMSRGVKLRIVKEPKPVGDSCDVFETTQSNIAECADEQKLVEEVRASGGSFEPYNKQMLCPNQGGASGSACYEHGKIALVDGIALMSTGNFDNSNLCIESDTPTTCNRDYSMVINDPTITSTLQNIFDADLKGVSYNIATIIPASLNNILTVSPISLQPIVDYINTAKISIDFETQYLNEPTINSALEAAAKRGVKVSVTTASVCSFGKPAAAEVQKIQDTYSAFDQAGISSKMFNSSNKVNGHAGYEHAKAIVVDGESAWMGSENGSTESMTENREFGIIFSESSWVQKISNVMIADHDSVDSETWQESLNCTKDHEGVANNALKKIGVH